MDRYWGSVTNNRMAQQSSSSAQCAQAGKRYCTLGASPVAITGTWRRAQPAFSFGGWAIGYQFTSIPPGSDSRRGARKRHGQLHICGFQMMVSSAQGPSHLPTIHCRPRPLPCRRLLLRGLRGLGSSTIDLCPCPPRPDSHRASLRRYQPAPRSGQPNPLFPSPTKPLRPLALVRFPGIPRDCMLVR